jgi:hypothetical protein
LAIDNAIGNGAAAVAFILHHARIGKGAMKKSGTSCQLWDKLDFTSEWCF